MNNLYDAQAPALSLPHSLGVHTLESRDLVKFAELQDTHEGLSKEGRLWFKFGRVRRFAVVADQVVRISMLLSLTMPWSVLG